jgi:hypothetical protein
VILGFCWLLPLSAAEFSNDTSQLGISMPHQANKMSTGIAVADFDNNGHPDLFFTGYDYDSQLYFNDGQSFATNPQFSMPDMTNRRCGSVSAADFNNDGWSDIYVACWGDNLLLRNDGGQGFTDLIHFSGTNHEERSEAVSWGDLNNDGWLDLVVATNPLTSNPNPSDPNDLDHVFLNNGDETFTDINGVLDPADIIKATLALVLTDIDWDNDLDIYFANDKYQGNVMLRNDGPGCGGWCFTNVASQQGSDVAAYCMGVAVGDYDNDQDWDLAYSSIDEHLLLQNTGTPTMPAYSDVAQTAGVNITTGYGWGTLIFDANNDGWEDMFLATTGGSPQTISNLLFLNDQQSGFTEQTAASGLLNFNPTQAAIWLDHNRDGKLDLAIGEFNIGYQLMTNITQNSHHWLALELLAGGSVNRDAIGSKVVLDDGQGNQQIRELRAGESRGSNNQPLLHFGLGAVTSVNLTVIWPNGETQVLNSVAVDQYLQLVLPSWDALFAGDFDGTD